MSAKKVERRVEFSLRGMERLALRWGHADARARALAPGEGRGKGKGAGLAGTAEVLSVSRDDLVFEATIEFDSQGLLLTRRDAKPTRIRWKEIDNVDSWFRGILFYCEPTLYVPDRCFESDEQRKDIVTLVAKKMGHL